MKRHTDGPLWWHEDAPAARHGDGQGQGWSLGRDLVEALLLATALGLWLLWLAG